jgi:hypothetical protein
MLIIKPLRPDGGVLKAVSVEVAANLSLCIEPTRVAVAICPGWQEGERLHYYLGGFAPLSGFFFEFHKAATTNQLIFDIPYLWSTWFGSVSVFTIWQVLLICLCSCSFFNFHTHNGRAVWSDQSGWFGGYPENWRWVIVVKCIYSLDTVK